MATQFDNRKDLQPSEWLEQRFRLSRRDSSVAESFDVDRCSGFCGVFLPSDCLAGVSAKQFAPVCVNKPN